METKKTTAEELGEGVARLREKALVQLEERGYHLRGKSLGRFRKAAQTIGRCDEDSEAE